MAPTCGNASPTCWRGRWQYQENSWSWFGTPSRCICKMNNDLVGEARHHNWFRKIVPLALGDIDSYLDISACCVCNIVREKHGYRWTSSQWVARILTENHKSGMTGFREEVVLLGKRVITKDEARMLSVIKDSSMSSLALSRKFRKKLYVKKLWR